MLSKLPCILAFLTGVQLWLSMVRLCLAHAYNVA